MHVHIHVLPCLCNVETVYGRYQIISECLIKDFCKTNTYTYCLCTLEVIPSFISLNGHTQHKNNLTELSVLA